jgi:hypothetical protein
VVARGNSNKNAPRIVAYTLQDHLYVQEKQTLVLQLYKENKTIREIAKEAKMLFKDIGAILKKHGQLVFCIIPEKRSLAENKFTFFPDKCTFSGADWPYIGLNTN